MLLRLVTLAALFGLLFGFDEGVIAGAMHLIEGSFTVSPGDKGFMAAAVPLGAVAGAILAAMWSDRFGRRLVLVLCAALFGVGALASAIAPSMGLLTIARLLLGIAIGASALAAPQYLAELAPPRVRGAVVSAFQLMITIGILVAYLSDLLLEPLGDWRLMLGLGAIPAMIAFLGVLRAPESPRWLVLMGRKKDAVAVLQQLEPDRTNAELQSTVQEIHAAGRQQGAEPGLAALFSPAVRPALFFAVTLFVLQQLSGINAVIYYAPSIMASAGFDGAQAQLLATVGIGAMNVAMTVVAMLLVDRLGRRPLLIFGFLGAALSLALIAVAVSSDGAGAAIAAFVGLLLYISFFAVSLGPLPWLYMSELFPVRLRSRGMAVASVANWSSNFLVVFLFPVIVSVAGMSATFGLFAISCAIGLVFSVRLALETKGRSLEEIEDGFAPVGAVA
ncbi:MAG: sugar porter family MFS transporter [Pseudomonadota bacterium]